MQGVFKYEKLNYSHRIHNIPKIKLKQEACRPDSSAIYN